MTFDAHKNLAVSTVATAPSPATSGTSLVVAAATGTYYPAVPFNATIWPAGSIPTPTNGEIVRVTARSTDTLTITRAQEGTSARTVVVGDYIAATITALTLTDIEGKFPIVTGDITDGTILDADISASAAIGIAKLAGYPTNAAKVLDGLGAWTAGFTKLFDSQLSGSAASIDTGASGVPQTHEHLLVLMNLRSDRASTTENSFFKVNNDTGANYDEQFVTFANTATTAGRSLGTTNILGGNVIAANGAASSFSANFVFFMNYRDTGKFKSIFGGGGGATSAGSDFLLCAGQWRSTTAISRLGVFPSVGPNFVSGSRMVIYGIG